MTQLKLEKALTSYTLSLLMCSLPEFWPSSLPDGTLSCSSFYVIFHLHIYLLAYVHVCSIGEDPHMRANIFSFYSEIE